MSSKFLDSMLTKYQAENGGPGSVVNYSTQHAAARMYPYVSMGAHHQSAGFPGAAGVVGYSNALASVAASGGVGDSADKTCRFTNATAASMAGMAEAMVNYSLGHQNGVGASAAAASMAQAAAGFYQAAGAAGPGGGSDPNNPLSACSHGAAAAAAGLGLAGVQSAAGADIPRYPWMSITGEILVFIFSISKQLPSNYFQYSTVYFLKIVTFSFLATVLSFLIIVLLIFRQSSKNCYHIFIRIF